MVDTAALREEGELLAAVVEPAGQELAGVTAFAGWTGWDVLHVLAFVDQMALLVLADRPAYERGLVRFSSATAGDPERVHDRLAAFARDAGPADRWRVGQAALCDELDHHRSDEPVPWFGRQLTVERLAAARQMETFAYGQDVADLLRVRRPATDRLRAVADFGVRTLGFSFANRGLAAPNRRPAVELVAPSGARWHWDGTDEGEPTERVSGPAEDFCLVVTQRRNVADTALRVAGEVATSWMAIAQTIAGPPQPGPAAGERAWE